MDILSDLLRVVRLDSAFFYKVEAANPWGVESVCATDLKPRIMPASQHLISYHILTEGHCYAGILGADPVEMNAGDVIVFPHQDCYALGNARQLARGTPMLRSSPPSFPNTVKLGDGSAPTAQFVCGFLGCDLRPFNPLLASLPRQVHIKGISSAWLTTFTQHVMEETRAGRAGSATVLTRMAEVMFIEVLRRYLDELPPGQSGWLAGLRDEVVGKALALLHEKPGQAWTLPSLAQATASSRTTLAKRFSSLVGEPPMQYLARWRMQVAANLLTEGPAKVATIAEEVGYDSEAAFSRAFKKATGLAPGAWRETRRR